MVGFFKPKVGFRALEFLPQRQTRRHLGMGVRSHPGLIIKMGGEIQYGWRHKAHSVVGVDWPLITGVWVAVEHEHPVFVEREFRSLCRLRRPLRSGFAVVHALSRCGSAMPALLRSTIRGVVPRPRRSSPTVVGSRPAPSSRCQPYG